MKVVDLISENNIELYNKMKSLYNIKLEQSGVVDIWTSKLVNKNAIIGYSECNNPESAFTHELLHIYVQSLGYRRLKKFGFNIEIQNSQKQDVFKTLFTALDNELQHHKMYSEFVQMGYAPEKFYCDSDIDTTDTILEFLEKPVKEKLNVVIQYITATSAGSELLFENQDDIKQRFRDKVGTRYKSVLNVVDIEIEKWKTNDEYDPINVYKEIIKEIPMSDGIIMTFGNSHSPNDRIEL